MVTVAVPTLSGLASPPRCCSCCILPLPLMLSPYTFEVMLRVFVVMDKAYASAAWVLSPWAGANPWVQGDGFWGVPTRLRPGTP